MQRQTTRSIFAPAKINLFLHITGQTHDAYHTLDSLVSFADIGDNITLSPSPSFSFEIRGPFANGFSAEDKGSTINSGNLVVKAARALSQIADKSLNVKIILEKNLPLTSGLGGGSADAAATLWGLQDFWDLPRNTDYLMPLMRKLGADIPVCMLSAPTLMRGIGDQLSSAPAMPEIPIVLVAPNEACSTKDVFLKHDRSFQNPVDLPKTFSSVQNLVNTLRGLDNDLTDAAIDLVPGIANVLNALEQQSTCLLARMSGSGASCFGIFESEKQAEKAAHAIQTDNPDWWVSTAWLNRVERY